MGRKSACHLLLAGVLFWQQELWEHTGAGEQTHYTRGLPSSSQQGADTSHLTPAERPTVCPAPLNEAASELGS